MSPTSPTPFVVLPNEEGEMTDTAKGAAQDSAEADRRAAYGEAVPTNDETADAAENSAEAGRRLDARRRVDGHPARGRRPRFLRDAEGSGPP